MTEYQKLSVFLQVYNELNDTAQLEYIPHTCIVIGNGLKSQIGIR